MFWSRNQQSSHLDILKRRHRLVLLQRDWHTRCWSSRMDIVRHTCLYWCLEWYHLGMYPHISGLMDFCVSSLDNRDYTCHFHQKHSTFVDTMDIPPHSSLSYRQHRIGEVSMNIHQHMISKLVDLDSHHSDNQHNTCHHLRTVRCHLNTKDKCQCILELEYT